MWEPWQAWQAHIDPEAHYSNFLMVHGPLLIIPKYSCLSYVKYYSTFMKNAALCRLQNSLGTYSSWGRKTESWQKVQAGRKNDQPMNHQSENKNQGTIGQTFNIR